MSARLLASCHPRGGRTVHRRGRRAVQQLDLHCRRDVLYVRSSTPRAGGSYVSYPVATMIARCPTRRSRLLGEVDRRQFTAGIHALITLDTGIHVDRVDRRNCLRQGNVDRLVRPQPLLENVGNVDGAGLGTQPASGAAISINVTRFLLDLDLVVALLCTPQPLDFGYFIKWCYGVADIHHLGSQE
jgi:hypothetical protein